MYVQVCMQRPEEGIDWLSWNWSDRRLSCSLLGCWDLNVDSQDCTMSDHNYPATSPAQMCRFIAPICVSPLSSPFPMYRGWRSESERQGKGITGVCSHHAASLGYKSRVVCVLAVCKKLLIPGSVSMCDCEPASSSCR